METNEKSLLRRFTDKVFGGLNMSWPAVILFAVVTAMITAVFLIVSVFKNTSFERMGVTFEAWIFFAIIIMTNCKTPVESALKTFVFFLMSQPLIYLFQVPFASMGWGLFGYYRYWFVWTLLTLPMAFAGWYIKKKNWLSLLILTPILFVLTTDYVGGFQTAFKHFPRMLLMAVFCLGQVLLYLYAFTENIWQKLLGFVIPLAVVLLLLFTRPQVEINGTLFLPNDPVLTEQAVVTVENTEIAEVSIAGTGQDSMVRVRADKYGTTAFTIEDGENRYQYTLDIYEDDAGYPQIRIIQVH